MSSLPDEAKLDELYLPGTHVRPRPFCPTLPSQRAHPRLTPQESLALHFPLLSSICQSTSLTSQLRGGIRFLDLRFALLDDGTLWAYHGVVPQRRRAEDVFDEVYAWLEGEGARECVVVSCKQVRRAYCSLTHTPEPAPSGIVLFKHRALTPPTRSLPSPQENPAPLFAPTLWSLLDRSSRSRSKWHDEDRWPALEEVRGKCVMFCRFGWDDRRESSLGCSFAAALLREGTDGLGAGSAGGLHPPTWPNDSRAAWRTSIGGRDTVVQDWVRTAPSLPDSLLPPGTGELMLSATQYGLSSPLALPRKASLALSLFDPSYSSLLPSPSPSPSDDQPPRLPHRISFLSCASFPLLYPSLAAKGFGLPSLGLGWRGVNDLVLRGLRRLALRDARLDGESGDETVKGDGRKGRGRRYEVGQGGMVLLLDFWECPAGGAGRNGRGGQEQRSSALVEELVRMNFA